MLTTEQIKSFIDQDYNSDVKKFARVGTRYYDGDHDIKDFRMFFYNADGNLVEDDTSSNAKIPHAFFTELVDQAVQYMLSSDDSFVKTDDPELQAKLDVYFWDEDFKAELSELLTDTKASGFSYMYAYKNAEDRTAFMTADSQGVVEVKAKDTDDDCDYIIYWYIDKIDQKNRVIKRIEVWDGQQTYYFVQTNEGEILTDDNEELNPKPHTLYRRQGDDSRLYYEGFGFIPFFRLDNNKKRFSDLKPIKELIDDYDLMASSLSNNLTDFDTPLYVVKDYAGDDMTELMNNIKTKKMIGVDEGGGVEVHTVDVPYQARQTKLELDEKNIYRFGMGLNTAGLKDTAATTNIAIKAAYSLLELKCYKLEMRLKQFLRKLLKVVIKEINDQNGTDYQIANVWFEFDHEVMSNMQENAQIELTEAQTQQTRITTLLNVAAELDNETLMQNICDVLDIDYEGIKDKLPDPDDAANQVIAAQDIIDTIDPTPAEPEPEPAE